MSGQKLKVSSKIQKILYSSKSLKEQCFIFTLNANEEVNNSSDSFEQPEVFETFPGGG